MQQQIKKKKPLYKVVIHCHMKHNSLFHVFHTAIKLQNNTTHYTTTYNFIQSNKQPLFSSLTEQLNILISNRWQTEQYIRYVPKTKNSGTFLHILPTSWAYCCSSHNYKSL